MPITTSSAMRCGALLSVLLLWAAMPVGAEVFEVEVVSGSTVSLVSGDAGGVRREVVTRADPNPPPPEPEVEEEPEPRDPVVVVVEPAPPRYYNRGVIVHSGFGVPVERPHRRDMRRRHDSKRGDVGHPRPGSSVRGGGMVGGVRR